MSLTGKKLQGKGPGHFWKEIVLRSTYYVVGKQGIELGTFTEQQTKSNGGKGDRVTEFLIAFLSSIYRAQSIRMSLSILEQHLAYTVQISSAFRPKFLMTIIHIVKLFLLFSVKPSSNL